jgi:hypothetical protein
LVHDDSLQLADCYATFHNWNFFYHAYHCLQLQEKKDLDESPGLYDGLVELKPGCTTTASWNGFTRSQQKGFIYDAISQFFVPPGIYPVTITVATWDTQSAAAQQSIERESYSEVVNVTIVAAQSTVIIGSIIGGLFAYLLLPETRFFADKIANANGKALAALWAGSVLSSVALSIIVTIMLSRLADSQFVVKVSVNDFLGAMSIGFVVSATGKAVLKKFVA